MTDNEWTHKQSYDFVYDFVDNSRETVLGGKGYETLHQELLDLTGFL